MENLTENKLMEENIRLISFVGFWLRSKFSTARLILAVTLQITYILSASMEIYTNAPTIEIVMDIVTGMFGTVSGFFVTSCIWLQRHELVELIEYVRKEFDHNHPITIKNETKNIKLVHIYANIAHGSQILFVLQPIIRYFMTGRWFLIWRCFIPFDISDFRYYLIAIIFQECTSVSIIYSVIPCTVFLTGLLQHINGQLEIVQEIFQNVIDDPADIKNKFRKGVEHHQCVIKFASKVQKFCDIVMTGSNLLVTMNLSMLLFRLTLLSGEALADKIAVFIAIFYCTFEFLLYCYFAQIIINQSLNVGGVLYQTDWYNFPIEIQKDLGIVLIRSNKPLHIRSLVYEMSFEMTTAVFQGIYSYFTLLVNFGQRKQ